MNTTTTTTTANNTRFYLSPHTKGASLAVSTVQRDEAVAALQGLYYDAVACDGAYQGAPEPSLAVMGSLHEAGRLALGLAVAWRQESVLAVTSGGVAWLMFTDSRGNVTLGTWVEVSKEEALAGGDYTRMADGTYYRVLPTKD